MEFTQKLISYYLPREIFVICKVDVTILDPEAPPYTS